MHDRSIWENQCFINRLWLIGFPASQYVIHKDVPESKWGLDTKSIIERSGNSGRRLSCLLRSKGKGGSSEEGKGSNSLHGDFFLEWYHLKGETKQSRSPTRFAYLNARRKLRAGFAFNLPSVCLPSSRSIVPSWRQMNVRVRKDKNALPNKSFHHRIASESLSSIIDTWLIHLAHDSIQVHAICDTKCA